jgi:hypothetical protein
MIFSVSAAALFLAAVEAILDDARDLFILFRGVLANILRTRSDTSSNVWFPEFPLSALLAAGRLYHHSWSVFAIFLAGKTVPPRQIAEGIPKAPFTLKFLTGDPEGTAASKMGSYLNFPPDRSRRRTLGLGRKCLCADYQSRRRTAQRIRENGRSLVRSLPQSPFFRLDWHKTDEINVRFRGIADIAQRAV